MNDVQEFFDIRASKWDSWSDEKPEFMKQLISLLSIKEGGRVLDLACGTGILTPYLLQTKAAYILGLDISPKMIEVAKGKFQENARLQFKAGDFYQSDCGEFDSIICFDAYPHFLDVPGFVKTAHQHLKKDGILLIAHDSGRVALDKHHDAHAKGVSRHLLPVEKEVKRFESLFRVIKIEETDSSYILLLKRK